MSSPINPSALLAPSHALLFISGLWGPFLLTGRARTKEEEEPCLIWSLETGEGHHCLISTNLSPWRVPSTMLSHSRPRKGPLRLYHIVKYKLGDWLWLFAPCFTGAYAPHLDNNPTGSKGIHLALFVLLYQGVLRASGAHRRLAVRTDGRRGT